MLHNELLDEQLWVLIGRIYPDLDKELDKKIMSSS